MGYMVHHAIIVTSWDWDALRAAHARATELCPDRVTPILGPTVNKYGTFLVGPDGSKDGWEESHDGDKQRDLLIEWMDAQRWEDGSGPLDWAEVQYGDEEHDTRILRHSDEAQRHVDRS